MTTTLSASGQPEIPEAFRTADGIQPGQQFEVERVGRGEYRVRVGEPVSGDASKQRLSEFLRSCQVKGFCEPIDRSETTDDLKPLLFELRTLSTATC